MLEIRILIYLSSLKKKSNVFVISVKNLSLDINKSYFHGASVQELLLMNLFVFCSGVRADVSSLVAPWLYDKTITAKSCKT